MPTLEKTAVAPRGKTISVVILQCYAGKLTVGISRFRVIW